MDKAEVPMGSTWCGRPLTELTRDELITAVERLGRDLAEERRSHMSSVNFMADLAKAKSRIHA